MRNFQWSYGSAPLRSDPRMNVQWAARLIRSWRKHGFIVTREKPGLIRCQVGDIIARMAFSKKQLSQ